MTIENNALTRRHFLRRMAMTATSMAAAAMLPQAAQAGLIHTPSPDEQKKVGEQAAKDILKKYKEVHDARADHFNTIGQRLVMALPEPDKSLWNFKFHVLDSKDVNAFALPGGNMFMFTGLYEKLDYDDSLAAVTGHEMTHVRAQHWARAYTRAQERSILGIGFLTLLGGRGGQFANIGAGLVDSLVGYKYSREEEAAADAGGLQDMVAAGYNPQGMILLFQTLQKVSGDGGSKNSAFLSDHPLTSDRIKAAQQQIAQIKQSQPFPDLTPLNYKALVG